MDSKRVRNLRKALKLTQEEFAQVLGVARESVARWEANMAKPRGLSIKMLEALASKGSRKPKRGARNKSSF